MATDLEKAMKVQCLKHDCNNNQDENTSLH